MLTPLGRRCRALITVIARDFKRWYQNWNWLVPTLGTHGKGPRLLTHWADPQELTSFSQGCYMQMYLPKQWVFSSSSSMHHFSQVDRNISPCWPTWVTKCRGLGAVNWSSTLKSSSNVLAIIVLTPWLGRDAWTTSTIPWDKQTFMTWILSHSMSMLASWRNLPCHHCGLRQMEWLCWSKSGHTSDRREFRLKSHLQLFSRSGFTTPAFWNLTRHINTRSR